MHGRINSSGKVAKWAPGYAWTATLHTDRLFFPKGWFRSAAALSLRLCAPVPLGAVALVHEYEHLAHRLARLRFQFLDELLEFDIAEFFASWTELMHERTKQSRLRLPYGSASMRMVRPRS